MDKNMKKYNSGEEISEAFIKDGWSVNTSFSEVTMEEAEKRDIYLRYLKSGRVKKFSG